MGFNLIRVLIVGQSDAAWRERIVIRNLESWEAAGFDTHAVSNDANIARVLVEVRPQVIVSLGAPEEYPELMAAPLDVRRRWLSVENPNTDPHALADAIMNAFVANATTERFVDYPLISVFTPTYLTGEKIERPHHSLLSQTYDNWEWVIYDDSPDAGRTFEQIAILAQSDQRITVYRGDRPIGNIGEVKRRACGLTHGILLLELDHDDELTPNALSDLVDAYRTFPDAGFFYSDCAEVGENGENVTYGEAWGLGYGSYRQERFRGHDYQVTNYPDINARTLRHIVGMPNHFRAWTRQAYLAAGGHNPEVHVCDDYELLLRTFLVTRFVHIQRFGYIQYHNNASSGNTQFARNAEIQRLVRYFRHAYNQRIHDRLVELGVDDFLWGANGELEWDVDDPHPAPMANERYA